MRNALCATLMLCLMAGPAFARENNDFFSDRAVKAVKDVHLDRIR